MQLKEAISTLRQGIDTILNCDVPYEQLDTALKQVEEKFTSTNTGSTECEQCEHFDISQGVYTVECYSCKRYYGDLFALRASA